MLFIVSALTLFGLVLGSFAGAQVWRLRARQLEEDKRAGQQVSAKEYARLKGVLRPFGDDRSMCLHCHHALRWYDLIPLISWLLLRGKCRYCRAHIGLLEPLVELGMAATFAASYVWWPFALDAPLEWIRFALWLLACVAMGILFVYDAKWSLLPFVVNITLIVIGVAFFAISLYLTPFGLNEWLSFAGAVALLAGLYYVFSIPGWVGLGDSILGLGLAVLLMSWDRAFLALFIANLVGCLALIPLAISRKLSRGAHIPFGPFLILGTLISFLWGTQLIAAVFDWSGALLNPFMV